MVFRFFVGNLIREAARGKLAEVTGQKEPPQPPPWCDVLIVTALPVESGGLVDRLEDVIALQSNGVTERYGRLADYIIGIVETGAGQQRAEAVLPEVITARQPQWVISAGFAGALDGELRRGHFVMGDTVALESGEQMTIGLTMDKQSLENSPGIHVGRLLTVDRILREPAEKRTLGQQHDALAGDMETFAVAKVCAAAKVRFLAVRVVSDAVDDELPPEVAKLLKQESTAAKMGAAAAALWNRPSAAKDLWQLKEDAIKASDRLAKFLISVIEQLPIEKRELPAPSEEEGDADTNAERSTSEA